jgi:hypothetical protein
MKTSRREFLASVLGCMAALGAGGKNRVQASGDKILPDGTTIKSGILHRELGKSGVILPLVSMGVMNARDPALIRKAYDSGMRHFDTAAAYGGGAQ